MNRWSILAGSLRYMQLSLPLFAEGDTGGSGSSDANTGDTNSGTTGVSTGGTTNSNTGTTGSNTGTTKKLVDYTSDEEADEADRPEYGIELDPEEVRGDNDADYSVDELRGHWNNYVSRKHHGSVRDAGFRVWRDMYKYRKALGEERTKRAQLEASMPGKGKAVIPVSDFATLNAFKELGVTPDEIKTLRANLHEYETKEATTARKADVNKAAEFADVNAAVLLDLIGDLPIAFEETDNSKKAFIVIKNGSTEKRTELFEYAKENWKAHMPSLTADKPSAHAGRKLIGARAPEGSTNHSNRRSNTTDNGVARSYLERTYGKKNKSES